MRKRLLLYLASCLGLIVILFFTIWLFTLKPSHNLGYDTALSKDKAFLNDLLAGSSGKYSIFESSDTCPLSGLEDVSGSAHGRNPKLEVDITFQSITAGETGFSSLKSKLEASGREVFTQNIADRIQISSVPSPGRPGALASLYKYSATNTALIKLSILDDQICYSD